MIKQIEYTDIERCAEVIRESFATVAKEFGLNEQNCPTHTSFTKSEQLIWQYNNGYLMFAYFLDGQIIGYVSLSKTDEEKIYKLRNLAVLPQYRHSGYGKELVDFCKEKVKSLGGNKISIGIIEENTRLKDWYTAYGFIHTGTKKFEQFPFTVGFMELEI